MAIVHTRLKVLSRSTRNTVAAVSYRAGTKLVDESTGEVFDYTKKPVEGVELLLPKDAPASWKELQAFIQHDKQAGVQKFSNIAEAHEKRIDSQVYREYEFALHRELTDEENKTLAREFVHDQICGLGMAALVNFHFDVNDEGERFPHAHVVMLTRRLSEKPSQDLPEDSPEDSENSPNGNTVKNMVPTLSKVKAREWNQKQWATTLRQQFCEYSNFHFKQKGIDITLDPRTYFEQGINLEPQIKIGRNVKEMEARSKLKGAQKATNRGQEHKDISMRNLYRIIQNPDIILEALSKQQNTFMWGDVAKFLARYVDDQQLFMKLSYELERSSSLVCIEQNGSLAQDVFTTRNRLHSEYTFVDTVKTLGKTDSHVVDDSVVTHHINEASQVLQKALGKPSVSLSEDQVACIQALSSPKQLVLTEGYAGAGKTTVMRVLRDIWESSGYAVYGLAPTGRAAENLSECDISSRTIDSFLHNYRSGRCQYDKNTVLVLDEAGMVNHNSFSELIQAVSHLGVKLVACGDQGQLSPVEAGIPFRLACDAIGKTSLSTIFRQKVPWQRDATILFGQGQAEKALQAYDAKGHFQRCADQHSDINERALEIKGITAELNKLEKQKEGLHSDYQSHHQNWYQSNQQNNDPKDEPSQIEKRLDHRIDTLKAKKDELTSDNSTVESLWDRQDHRGIVELYNLSRRLAGNIAAGIFHDIEQDIKQEKEIQDRIVKAGIELPKKPQPSKIARFFAHEDAPYFSEWKSTRESTSSLMRNHIDEFRPHMKELGVDGVDFARKLIGYDKKLGGYDEEKAHDLAKDLEINWRGLSQQHVCDPRLETKKTMVNAWFTSYQTHKSDTQTMMAFSNQDVEGLNQQARSLLCKIGDIGSQEFTYTVLKRDGEELGVQKTKCVDRSFSVGDQLVFTRNDNSLGVKNGTLGRIKSLDQHNIVVTLYDKDADTGEPREVSFSPNLYNHFDNGWAVTLHKNQGVTVDRSFVLASFEHYKNLSYVAMTRHVKDVELYISSTEFWREDKVFERLGRAQEKLSSLDYVADDKVTDLLRRDENHLLAVLDQVGHHLQAIGYVGKRQFETLWSRFFNKPLDRNLIYVDPHVRDAVRSEAERFDEKYNTSETDKAFTKELDSQSPEELFRQLYPKEKLRYTDEEKNNSSQDLVRPIDRSPTLSEKEGVDIEGEAKGTANHFGGRKTEFNTQFNLQVETRVETQVETKVKFAGEALGSKAATQIKSIQAKETQEKAFTYSHLNDSEVTVNVSFRKPVVQTDIKNEDTGVDAKGDLKALSETSEVTSDETKAAAPVLEKEVVTERDTKPEALKPESLKIEAQAVIEAPKKEAEVSSNEVSSKETKNTDSIPQSTAKELATELVQEPQEKGPENSQENVQKDIQKDTQENTKITPENTQDITQDSIEAHTKAISQENAPINTRDNIETNTEDSIEIKTQTAAPKTSPATSTWHKTTHPHRHYQKLNNRETFLFAEKVNDSIQAEDLAKDLLRPYGLNTRSSGSNQLRFGELAHLAVNIGGQYENTWKDFETNEGGSLLKLIRREKNCDFESSIAYAAHYCRGSIRTEIDRFLESKTIDRAAVAAIPQKDKNQAKEAHLELQRQKIADVKALVQKSVHITNTPAETYLRRERHIQGVLPESLRYVPAKTQYTYNGKSKYIKEGALISIAKSSNDEIQAVQLTYLTEDGKPARNKEGNKFTKITYGSSKGAYVTLQQGNKDQPFIMAEGVETALSVKESGVKGTVVCSLGIGNYKNIIHDQKDVVVVADWDGSTEMPTYKAAEKAKQQVEDLTKDKGGKAHIILPVSSTEETKDKTDFNDVLQTKGVAYVKELVKNQCHHICDETAESHAEKTAPETEKSNESTNCERDNRDARQSTNSQSRINDATKDRANDSTDNTITGNQSQTPSHQLEHTTKTSVAMGEDQSCEKTHQDDPQNNPEDTLKQNILKYFNHELGLEKNAAFDKQSILEDVNRDPMDALKWWQKEFKHTPFDAHQPFSNQIHCSTPEAIKQNIITYFQHELMNKPNVNKEDILSDVNRDPMDALSWWQKDCGGSPFNPHKRFEDQQGQEEAPKGDERSQDITNDPLHRLQSLDKQIDFFMKNDGYEKSLKACVKERDALLSGMNESSFNDLKRTDPVLSRKLEDHRQTIQNQSVEPAKGIDLSL